MLKMKGKTHVSGRVEDEVLVTRLFSERPPNDVHRISGRSLKKRVFLYSVSSLAVVLAVLSSPLLLLAAVLYGMKRLIVDRIKSMAKRRLTPEEALAKMTTREKVKLTAGVTTFTMSGCARLGIPPVKFTDGPSGARGLATIPKSLLQWGLFADLPIMRNKIKFQDPNLTNRSLFLKALEPIVPDILTIGPGTFAVCAPAGTALASTWNRKIAYDIAALIGRDTRQKGAHVILGPTLNLTRTPTGGRNFEAFGEDPFLAGCFGIEWVNGAQSVPGIAACVKHFAANELEHKRFASDSIVAERPLRELYLRHFEMVVKETDVASIMTGYNKVNGTYACMNDHTIRDILRGEWGFDGVVMSDWGGAHGTVESIQSGELLDLEMPGPPRVRGKKLLSAVKTGEVPEESINMHALRLLKFIDRTRGPFGPGYPTSHEPELPSENTIDDKLLQRQAIREGLVLLKNEDALPLPKSASISLYGPNAVELAVSGGGSVETMCRTPQTLQSEMRRVFHSPSLEQVLSGKYGGMELADENRFTPFTIDVFPSALDMSNTSKSLGSFTATIGKYLLPTVNLATWSFISNPIFKGVEWNTAGVRVSTTLMRDVEAKAGETSIHTFSLAASGPARLSINGEELLSTPTNFEEDSDVWGYNCMGFGCKEVFAELELDDSVDHVVNIEWSAHGGFLTENVQQGYLQLFQNYQVCPFGYQLKHMSSNKTAKVLAEVTERAAQTDINVVCVGRQPGDETEFKDTTSMELPDGQRELILAVAEGARTNANKTVVLVNAGSPVDVSQWSDEVDAVMIVHFVGQEGAQGICDVLSGEYPPSGKLVYTIPKSFEDNPTYSESGHMFPGTKAKVRFDEGLDVGYRYYDRFPDKVAYPFGFGLSYGKLTLGECSFQNQLKSVTIPLSVAQSSTGQDLVLSVHVANQSEHNSSEVIQIYTGLDNSEVARPIKQLIGFEKVFVNAGESKMVDVRFSTKYSFEYFDERLGWTVEPGTYTIYVATSAQDIHQQLALTITRDL